MPFGGTSVTFRVLGCMMVGPSQTCDALRGGMLLRAFLAPVSSIVYNSGELAFGRMCPRRIASRIPAPSMPPFFVCYYVNAWVARKVWRLYLLTDCEATRVYAMEHRRHASEDSSQRTGTPAVP